MREVFLILAVFAIFLFGFYIIKRMGDFWEENYDSIQKEKEVQEPSSIMLTDEMPEEELIREIRTFSRKHENVRILVYGSGKEELLK